MIHRYEVLELGDYSRRIGEDNVKLVLGTFECPLNHEVQDFLLRKATQAEKLKSAGIRV